MILIQDSKEIGWIWYQLSQMYYLNIQLHLQGVAGISAEAKVPNGPMQNDHRTDIPTHDSLSLTLPDSTLGIQSDLGDLHFELGTTSADAFQDVLIRTVDVLNLGRHTIQTVKLGSTIPCGKEMWRFKHWFVRFQKKQVKACKVLAQMWCYIKVGHNCRQVAAMNEQANAAAIRLFHEPLLKAKAQASKRTFGSLATGIDTAPEHLVQ